MNLVLFLKTLAELCFYFCFACTVGSFLSIPGSLLPAAFLLALLPPVASLLAGRTGRDGLRFLALPLLGLLWLLRPGVPALLLFAMPAFYTVWIIVRKRFETSHAAFSDNFLLFAKILAVPPVLLLITGYGSTVKTAYLPPLAVYLVAGFLALRILRHDRATMENRRFRLLNIALAAGITGAALLLTVDRLRQALFAAVGWIYDTLIRPVLMLGAYIVGGIGWVLEKIFKAILATYERPEQQQQEQQLTTEDIFGEIEETAKMPFLQTLLKVLGIALLALIAFLILRWLWKRLSARAKESSDAGGTVSRLSLDEEERSEEPLRRRDARTPALKIRFYYRKVLQLLHAAGGSTAAGMTTEEQLWEELRLFPDIREDAEELRALYLPARYGEEAAEADAARARELYHRLRAAFRHKKEAAT